MNFFKKYIVNIFSTKTEKTKEKTTNVEKGNIKFYNRTKGFGFITTTGSSKDIFVHKSGLIDKVKKEDKVMFETENSPKGIKAINVRLA